MCCTGATVVTRLALFIALIHATLSLEMGSLTKKSRSKGGKDNIKTSYSDSIRKDPESTKQFMGFTQNIGFDQMNKMRAEHMKLFKAPPPPPEEEEEIIDTKGIGEDVAPTPLSEAQSAQEDPDVMGRSFQEEEEETTTTEETLAGNIRHNPEDTDPYLQFSKTTGLELQSATRSRFDEQAKSIRGETASKSSSKKSDDPYGIGTGTKSQMVKGFGFGEQSFTKGLDNGGALSSRSGAGDDGKKTKGSKSKGGKKQRIIETTTTSPPPVPTENYDVDEDNSSDSDESDIDKQLWNQFTKKKS